MENQREKLVELIESQFGLLEKLLKMHAITRNQWEQIQCEPTRVKINKMMLDYIFQESKHKVLITALSESSQSHLVNWIKSGGVYSEEFGFDWPLTERQHEILDANLEELIDIIDNCELISTLYSGLVINKRQRDDLHSKSTDHKKNEALLEMVRRFSQKSFQTLINCLKNSNQGHIADILQNGGAILPVHASLETDNLDETETQIVDEFTNVLMQRNVSAEQANRLLSAVQLNIIAVKRGQSIVLYICSRNENEFNVLCKMIDNSEMKNFLQKLFVALTYNIDLKVLSVKIHESDINKARQMFTKIPAKAEISQMEPRTIDDLPLELTDVIIQKSFAIFIQIKSQIDDEKDEDGFKQLAEVNDCWFKRMTNRRFKKYRWSYLLGIYEKKTPISIFWRNNQQFIEENVIQLRTGANRLKDQDLLSDIQCALIARKSSTSKKAQSSNKSTDLSLILNHKNETSINLFIEYLRSSGRRWIAKAMRNCGASVRVEINGRSPIEDEKITSFFEDSGSESLGSIKDRDFVRWIWCKSSDPKQLQHLEESPHLINEIRINMDSDQLKKKAVVHEIFDESLETIDEQHKAVGVTKLRNEFYCLNYGGKIKVFYDQYPFVLQRKFQLKEMKKGYDIVSHKKENALYILDLHRRPHDCVWKIEQISKTNQSEIKWLELPDVFQPKFLSMTKSGQLLMVSRDPCTSLRVYGPDAQLHLSVSLHQYIEWPVHAVETSTGNFVILHFLEKEDESTITTLSRDGKTIVHNYQPENEKQQLSGFDSGNLRIDSNDRVFVTDYYNERVILLNSNLRWNQILFLNNEGKDEDSGKKTLLHPRRLYYDEGKKQLVVCGNEGLVTVFYKRF